MIQIMNKLLLAALLIQTSLVIGFEGYSHDKSKVFISKKKAMAIATECSQKHLENLKNVCTKHFDKEQQAFEQCVAQGIRSYGYFSYKEDSYWANR